MLLSAVYCCAAAGLIDSLCLLLLFVMHNSIGQQNRIAYTKNTQKNEM